MLDLINCISVSPNHLMLAYLYMTIFMTFRRKDPVYERFQKTLLLSRNLMNVHEMMYCDIAMSSLRDLNEHTLVQSSEAFQETSVQQETLMKLRI